VISIPSNELVVRSLADDEVRDIYSRAIKGECESC